MTKTVAVVALIFLAAFISLSSTGASASWVAAQVTSPVYSTPKSQRDGVYSDVQAKRGETLYVENCSACHGMGLGGGFGPPLTGPVFLAKWGNRSLGEIFELMRVTMPQTFPGGFGRQQNADILAFILQKGKSPAGNSELVGEADVLNQIRFVPEKQ